MKIGIVGSGIVGRLIAWHLCQRNYEVHIFTKGSTQSEDACSSIAAGMISPFAELPILPLSWHKLGLTALKWWPKILSTLPGHVYYRDQGTLVICSPSQKALLQHYIAQIKHKVPDISISILNERELQKIEPALCGKIGCHLMDAQISPAELFLAMNNYFLNKQVAWYPFQQVHTITAKKIISDKGYYEFDKIIDCRGIGAKNVIPTLRGVRGEIIFCHAPRVDLLHTIRLLHPRFPCYIVPMENKKFALGASQIESESTAAITMQSAVELMSQALLVHPGFHDANIIQMQAACRPTMPNHLPYLQSEEGVSMLNGMFRHGFMLAPALTSELIKKWIDKNDKRENKLTPFLVA